MPALPGEKIRMHIVHHKQAVAQITITASAFPVERHAAEELQRYLCEMSGVKVPIAECPATDRPNVYLGAAAHNAGLDLSETTLGFDGFVVKTVGEDMILSGSKPYACLYAVYHLLARYLGCGFFEDGDQIPRRETITLAQIDEQCKPRFRHRQFIHACQLAYATRWWTFPEWKSWLDYGAKMRFNVANLHFHLGESGVARLVWQKCGVDIALTAFQQQQIAMYQQVVQYARLLGMRITLPTTRATTNLGHIDSVDFASFDAFYTQYHQTVRFIESQWGGWRVLRVSPLEPFYSRLISLFIEEIIRLYGTDHLYQLEPPSEENLVIDDPRERDRVVQGMLRQVIATVRARDAEAIFLVNTWCLVGEDLDEQRRLNSEAQLTVIKEEPGIIVMESDVVLAPVFLKKQYFFGKPWIASIMYTGGGNTGLYGYLATVIQTLQQQIVRDPKAAMCIGFASWTESRDHNHYFFNCLAELAWDPMQVMLGDFLRRYAVARYGPAHGLALLPALHALNASAFNTALQDAMNRPFYRLLGWRWGDQPDEQERMMALQEPDVLLALQQMLAAAKNVADSPMFQRDLVDVTKLYLAIRLSAYKRQLMDTAQQMSKDDGADELGFEEAAARLLACMCAMAQVAGSIPHYRLRTEEEQALRWPPMDDTQDNLRFIRERRTILLDLANWCNLLDYWGEDLQELLEFYYLPRVEARIDAMRNGLADVFTKENAQQVTGLLMNFTPGAPHPADEEIVRHFVIDGYPRETVTYYEGSLPMLIAEVLAQFPGESDRNNPIGVYPTPD